MQGVLVLMKLHCSYKVEAYLDSISDKLTQIRHEINCVCLYKLTQNKFRHTKALVLTKYEQIAHAYIINQIFSFTIRRCCGSATVNLQSSIITHHNQGKMDITTNNKFTRLSYRLRLNSEAHVYTNYQAFVFHFAAYCFQYVCLYATINTVYIFILL